MTKIKAKIPKKFKSLFNPARYKVFYGGRGAAKSRTIATALVLRASSGYELILCTREYQTSIRDSVKKVIENEIERLGLSDRFTITDQTIVNNETGSAFIFAGLFNNVDNIKSTEGVTICWIEEGQTISDSSIKMLFPTIREENSEIWISYNPRYESDPIHQKFVINSPPKNSIVVNVNYNDNPWFPQVLRDQMEHDKESDYDNYQHVWLGRCITSSKAQVLHGVWQAVPDTPEPPDGTVLRYGLDFGFSVDPTAVVRCWISGKTLYIDREQYGHKVELEELPEFVKSTDRQIQSWNIVADCSRPETISLLNNNGLSVVSSKKGRGSIIEGIQRIRGYSVVINEQRCPNVIDEFSKYSYKIDNSTGLVTPVIVDSFNHLIDALRYAIENTDAQHIFDPITARIISERRIDVLPPWYTILGGIRIGSTADDIAAVLIAHDTDTGAVHLLRTWIPGTLSSPVALWSQLQTWGKRTRWVYTGCGLNADRRSIDNIVEQYNDAGFKLVHGQHDDGLESGTSAMLDLMLTGRFKASSTLVEFWDQFNGYFRVDGRIESNAGTSIIDACRVAVLNKSNASSEDRHEQVAPEPEVEPEY